MKKTIAYMRASTNEERQDTAHQRRSIERFAESNGFTIDEWYEEYISAYKTSIDNREQIQKVKELAIMGQIENLIIFESSRLARNMTDQISIMDTFTRCNVKVYSVKDGRCINQNDIDKLMNAFMSYFNEASSRDTSARIKSQKRLAKERGLWLGGKVLYGYKIVNNEEVIDEEAQPIIIETYKKYINEGARAAMDYLANYTDRYNVNSTLLQYMRNPKLEAIVGSQLYNKFMQEKSLRSTNSNNTVKTFRSQEKLEGLLYHTCGGKLTVDYDRGKLRYVCKKCKKERAAIKKTFTGYKLTNNIEEGVLQVLNSLDKDELTRKYESESREKLNAIHRQIKSVSSHIRTKESDINKANKNLEKLLINAIDPSVLNVLVETIKSMEESLDRLRAEYNQLKQEAALEEMKISEKEDLIDSLLDFKYLYTKGTYEQQKAILQRLIDKVIVTDTDDFAMYLNF